MLVIASLISLLGVSYGPPSEYAAERAVATRFAIEAYGGDVGVYGGNYPAQVRLDRCKPVEQRPVQTDLGLRQVYSGYACIMTVSREALPEYQVSGFFHFDGIDWDYYGPIRESLIVEPDTFDIVLGRGEITPKPGGVMYNGRRSVNDKTSPYENILRDYDLIRKPSEQPPHDDIFSVDRE